MQNVMKNNHICKSHLTDLLLGIGNHCACASSKSHRFYMLTTRRIHHLFEDLSPELRMQVVCMGNDQRGTLDDGRLVRKNNESKYER